MADSFTYDIEQEINATWQKNYKSIAKKQCIFCKQFIVEHNVRKCYLPETFIYDSIETKNYYTILSITDFCKRLSKSLEVINFINIFRTEIKASLSKKISISDNTTSLYLIICDIKYNSWLKVVKIKEDDYDWPEEVFEKLNIQPLLSRKAVSLDKDEVKALESHIVDFCEKEIISLFEDVDKICKLLSELEGIYIKQKFTC